MGGLLEMYKVIEELKRTKGLIYMDSHSKGERHIQTDIPLTAEEKTLVFNYMSILSGGLKIVFD